MFRKILFFAIAAALVWMVFKILRRAPKKVARMRDLDANDLHQALQNGQSWLVLDVRGRAEFSDDLGHIAAARHIPLEALSKKIGRYATTLQQPIALICRTGGNRSREAQRILFNLGYLHVHVVSGGMQRWVDAKLPVVR